MQPSLFRRTYATLLIVRLGLGIFGTGYIHPDEYFQNGEVTAGTLRLQDQTSMSSDTTPSGEIFGFHTLRTWEWGSALPVRSVLPPYITTGLPFLFAKTCLNGRIIFLA